jgi:VWFA-related protein
MELRMIRPFAAALCSLALALPAPEAPAAGAARTKKKLKKFEEETRVVEVQVPVNVVGKDGQSVRGLTQESFRVFDGGREREIVDFQVIDLEQLAPGDTRTEIDRAVPSAARRHFLLLFDLSFSSPNLIVRAREAARQFVLENVHPTDLVGVAVHTVETGGRMLVTFTPDRAQVARAIDTLGAPRLVSLARRDPLLFLIDSPNNPNLQASADISNLDDPNTGPSNALQESVAAHLRVIGRQIEKMERSFSRGRVSSWSRSMGEMARFMDSVRGRKHVVFFSEGFDGSLLLGKQPSANDPQLQQDLANIQGGQLGFVDTDDIYGNVGLQNEMARMLEEFRRADAVIHAVDISGLRADSEAAERARSVGQDALFYIANDTGGELYQDITDFGEDLTRVLERTEVTYLLTFQASDVVPDGAYHRINVKVETPGKTKLVHRDGYYAPRPFEELHPLEKSLLAADAIASGSMKGQLDLNVLVAPFKANLEAAYVPIIIEVGGRELLFEQTDDEMSVEFYAYVTNDKGEMKDFFTQLVTLDLSNGRSAFARTGLKYYGHMDLIPGGATPRPAWSAPSRCRSPSRSSRSPSPSCCRPSSSRVSANGSWCASRTRPTSARWSIRSRSTATRTSRRPARRCARTISGRSASSPTTWATAACRCRAASWVKTASRSRAPSWRWWSAPSPASPDSTSCWRPSAPVAWKRAATLCWSTCWSRRPDRWRRTPSTLPSTISGGQPARAVLNPRRP